MRAALVAAAIAALLGALLGYAWRDRGATADLAECQRVHADAMATLLRAARDAEAEFRAKEQTWEAQKQEIVHEARTEVATARADADRVRAALERLRRAQAAAASGGDAAAHPAAAAGSEAAGATANLPADLLIRLGQAAGELAQFADESRIAGLACERSYSSVTTPRL